MALVGQRRAFYMFSLSDSPGPPLLLLLGLQVDNEKQQKLRLAGSSIRASPTKICTILPPRKLESNSEPRTGERYYYCFSPRKPGVELWAPYRREVLLFLFSTIASTPP